MLTSKGYEKGKRVLYTFFKFLCPGNSVIALHLSWFIVYFIALCNRQIAHS